MATNWQEHQAMGRELAASYGLAHPATEQPYRGITIYWYRIVPQEGPTQYATAWQINATWHQTPAFENLMVAIDTAEAAIDRHLADRVAVS